MDDGTQVVIFLEGLMGFIIIGIVISIISLITFWAMIT